jgi:hypothetical protein
MSIPERVFGRGSAHRTGLPWPPAFGLDAAYPSRSGQVGRLGSATTSPRTHTHGPSPATQVAQSPVAWSRRLPSSPRLGSAAALPRKSPRLGRGLAAHPARCRNLSLTEDVAQHRSGRARHQWADRGALPVPVDIRSAPRSAGQPGRVATTAHRRRCVAGRSRCRQGRPCRSAFSVAGAIHRRRLGKVCRVAEWEGASHGVSRRCREDTGAALLGAHRLGPAANHHDDPYRCTIVAAGRPRSSTKATSVLPAFSLPHGVWADSGVLVSLTPQSGSWRDGPGPED